MKLIEPGYRIYDEISEGGVKELTKLERNAKVSYQSYKGEDFERTKRFLSLIIKRGHESVLEHGGLTVIFTTDRAIANELVRHRIASFTQESTRYCRYRDGLTFIKPSGYDAWSEENRNSFDFVCIAAENRYTAMLDGGLTPEEARAVLPLCLKTEIVVTTNWREWRHILKLRTAKDAHPDMVALMMPLLKELQDRIPVLFDDI